MDQYAKGDFWFRVTPDSFDPKTGQTGVYLEIFTQQSNPVSGFIPLSKVRMMVRMFAKAHAETLAQQEQRSKENIA